ncbi:MAG: hypothetical protein LBH94_00070, partial [Deltaproteobacteria bacterium]|jgi:hypothetical protein|nr:hypothetical protein [Deltaproteobacteria bacterium]
VADQGDRANQESWLARHEQSVAKIEALCTNGNVMDAICGRMPNAGEADNEERYQQNIDAALRGWAEAYAEEDWSL